MSGSEVRSKGKCCTPCATREPEVGLQLSHHHSVSFCEIVINVQFICRFWQSCHCISFRFKTYMYSISFCFVLHRLYKRFSREVDLYVCWKMLYSEYMKRRALFYQAQGLSPSGIAHALAQEGLVATRQGIAKSLWWVEETGNLHRRPGSGRQSKMMPQALSIVEAQMQNNFGNFFSDVYCKPTIQHQYPNL